MAPSRTLVNQQMQSCYRVMGPAENEVIGITSDQNKTMRAAAWREKRIFYCTPQVILSAINDNEMNFPLQDIKLIVIDEAHQATDQSALAEVVRAVQARNNLFRVLALTAAPGRNLDAIVAMVQNLLISHIEIRNQNSYDVAPYVVKRDVEARVVALDKRLTRIRDRLYDLVQPYVQNLKQCKAIVGDISNLTKEWLLHDRNKFRMAANNDSRLNQTQINTDFDICISLFHAIELLERHGVQIFCKYFNANTTDKADPVHNDTAEKTMALKIPKIKHYIAEVQQQCDINPPSDGAMEGPIDYGHPKFDILQDCLLAHFQVSSS